MKELPIRKFTTVVGYLTEDVTITVDGLPIGVYRPFHVLKDVKLYEVSLSADGPGYVTEVPMDDIAKKAIEPEKTKANRGRLTKGLGDLPGEEPKPTVERDPYKTFTPAPKPGKK